MKFEKGAGNINYEYHSASAQLVREVRKVIKDPRKQEATLEILRAVNMQAFDRGALHVLRQINKVESPVRPQPIGSPARHLCFKHRNQFGKGV